MSYDLVMNSNQKSILWLALIVLTVILVYPPYDMPYSLSPGPDTRWPRSPIFNSNFFDEVQLNICALIFRISVLTAITAAAYLFHSTDTEDRQKSDPKR